MAKACLNKLGANILQDCTISPVGIKEIYLMHAEDVGVTLDTAGGIATAVFLAGTKSYRIEGFKQNIQIFNDTDIARSTFEICLYADNQDIFDSLFSSGRRTLTVQEYMLKNKADCAFTILESNTNLTVPQYISSAIQWIRE